MNPEKAETQLHDDHVCGFRCSICGFLLDGSYGGYLYLKNNNGVRVPLRDREEQETIARMLFNQEEPQRDNLDCFHDMVDTMEERVGYVSACICMHCLDQFGLDLRKDALECPHCKSDHIRTFLEMTDKRCPRCQSGHMEETG